MRAITILKEVNILHIKINMITGNCKQLTVRSPHNLSIIRHGARKKTITMNKPVKDS